jgi:hypothetical protein
MITCHRCEDASIIADNPCRFGIIKWQYRHSLNVNPLYVDLIDAYHIRKKSVLYHVIFCYCQPDEYFRRYQIKYADRLTTFETCFTLQEILNPWQIITCTFGTYRTDLAGRPGYLGCDYRLCDVTESHCNCDPATLWSALQIGFAPFMPFIVDDIDDTLAW